MINEQIEGYSIRHWPGHETLHYDNWTIKFSNGYTKRANCIAIEGESRLPLLSKISYCEELYKAKCLSTIFKLTSFQNINKLDKLLDEHGYVKESESLVLTMELNKGDTIETLALNTSVVKNSSPIYMTSIISIKQNFAPKEDWLQFQYEVKNMSIQEQQSLKKIVHNIKCETNYMILEEEGKAVASCLAVLEDHYISVYCLVTAPTHRNKGYATQLLLHLFEWGRQKGATLSYILVDAHNVSATSLYYKLGYSQQYSYWFRVKTNTYWGKPVIDNDK